MRLSSVNTQGVPEQPILNTIPVHLRARATLVERSQLRQLLRMQLPSPLPQKHAHDELLLQKRFSLNPEPF